MCLQHDALAGAAAAEDHGGPAPRHLEADLVEHRETPEALRHVVEADRGSIAAHSAVSGNTKKIRRTSTTLAAIMSIEASTTLRVADRPTPWVPCEVCMPM